VAYPGGDRHRLRPGGPGDCRAKPVAILKDLLLALAIIDDLGAVALIAVLFSDHVDKWDLAGAASAVTIMAMMGRWRNAPYFFYAVLFAIAWAFTLKSGVNTSLVGVAAAMTIPLEPRRTGQVGVLNYFMDSLHPYVSFLILPAFAFAASGFSFRDLSLGTSSARLRSALRWACSWASRSVSSGRPAWPSPSRSRADPPARNGSTSTESACFAA